MVFKLAVCSSDSKYSVLVATSFSGVGWGGVGWVGGGGDPAPEREQLFEY